MWPITACCDSAEQAGETNNWDREYFMGDISGVAPRRLCVSLLVAFGLLLATGAVQANSGSNDGDGWWGGYGGGYEQKKKHNTKHRKRNRGTAQLGPRPYYLIDEMDPSLLKYRLESCSRGPFYKSDFSIGHRGAPLQFPEHTEESYRAAARMGAGILECDVTFTEDRQLVCRHAQCDLHTTTNILATDLASSCRTPFSPAEYDGDGNLVTPATAQCCTSEITLREFKTLCGKMDAADRGARTVAEYLGGTADFRTDLYTTCGTLMTHAESIDLFEELGTGMTPELKAPQVEMPFQGEYTQADYARQLIDEYKAAGVHPRKVWAQSFNLDDVLYWIENEPRFGRQAVFLDSRVYSDPSFEPTLEDFLEKYAEGVRVIAPPMFALLEVNSRGRIVPSDYARLAKQAGLDIITWTTERSGRIVEDVKEGGGTFYYQTTLDAIDNDGAIMETLHVLAKRVKVLGVFSDWPATTTYYANCMDIP